MAKERLSMGKIESVLDLHNQGHSGRRIARSLGLSRSTVNDYLQRAQAAGVGWPLPPEWDEPTLHRALFGGPSPPNQRPVPDWAYIKSELRKKGVTLQLLHDEYLALYLEDGYRYSQFCEHYRRFRKTVDISMRQDHRAGEKLFVDYAGQTVPIVDPATGKVSQAHLFVAVLGASNYTYAEATATEQLEDWIAAHVNAFEYFAGVTELIIPDNTKCAVIKPCRYEPELNPTYIDLGRHYGTAMLPTRIVRPKDKAKVEGGVLIAERWILAALRKRTFFSLGELNRAIRGLLEKLNHRPFKKLPGSRHSTFIEQEKSLLRPLPSHRFEFAEWRQATVNIDYHVSVQIAERKFHYYSVPYKLVRQKVDVRLTRRTVELFLKGTRVAAHARSNEPGKHTTVPEHMPDSHRRHLEWSPSRILNWVGKAGPSCREVAQQIMDDCQHPEQGYRRCLGLIRLGDKYSTDRLEAACKRAMAVGLPGYRSVASMLKTNLDKKSLPQPQQSAIGNASTHIRGGGYYS